MPRYPLIATTVLGLCITAAAVIAADDFAGEVQRPIQKSIEIQQKTQQARDQWQAVKAEQVARMEALQERKVRLQAENRDLTEAVQRQRDKVDEARRQLTERKRFAGEMLPFLQRIREDLLAVLAADGPLLEAERRTRLERLADTMADPGLPVSEKYRKTMEALLIEAEYGSTIEVTTQSIELPGGTRVARVLRLGRMSQFFETLDGTQVGGYDPAAGAWTLLADTHRQPIHTAVEIASKRRPARLVPLPVGRIVPQ